MTLTKRSQSQLSELAPSSFSSPELISSPAATLRGHHKHTLSKPISWLSRNSSSPSNRSMPHAAPKPTRVSEPKFGSSLEQFGLHRSGPLGSGATVVRTPQEALSGSPRAFRLISEEEDVKEDLLLDDTDKSENNHPPPRPSSPPLPPLPDASDGDVAEDKWSISSSLLLSDRVSHSRSSSSMPPAPRRSSSRPTLLAHSRALSRSTPSLPADADPIQPQPPFDAIPLSSIPDGTIDPSKLIVTLETCTTTYRTTLRSLVSRPSHLSRYITSLLSPASETASIYSNTSDTSLAQHHNWFNSVFRDHLASSGCLPQSSTGIHIFLDRPSTPYVHVLAYLRSLPGAPEQPETLPRAVQFGSTSPSTLESLLDLRDEASYLGLEELYKLCCREIDRFQHPSALGSVLSGGSGGGKLEAGSVRSFHTLVEQSQPHMDREPSEHLVSRDIDGCTAKSSAAARKSSSSSSYENKEVPPARGQRQWCKGIQYELGIPPPGWI